MRLGLKTRKDARKFVNETLTSEWRISAFLKLKKALKLAKTEE